MSRKIATKGTKTTTGGEILEGIPDITLGGQEATVVGMQCSCKSGRKCCKGIGKIVAIGAANPVFFDGGQQAVLQGYQVLCGCPDNFICEPTHDVDTGIYGDFRIGKGVHLGNGFEFGKEPANPMKQFVPPEKRFNPVLDQLIKDCKELEAKWEAEAAAQQTQKEPETKAEPEPIPQQDDWKPVQGNFPMLVFETQNKMDDFNAPDMVHGDETKEQIIQYGFMRPFAQSEYTSPREGYTLKGEDQFALPASEHFKRMRNLGYLFSSQIVGEMMKFKTSQIYYEMVDKFERREGGYYSNPLLTDALKTHETTTKFHDALKNGLSNNIQNGVLPTNITAIMTQYMQSSQLPQFLVSSPDTQIHRDLFNGGVVSVHGIWSMRVYVDSLEYQGNEIRGQFRYEVQDHFGLNTEDINHAPFGDDPEKKGKPFELLSGFRSWYLLQHYKGYDYQPFITQMNFTL